LREVFFSYLLHREVARRDVLEKLRHDNVDGLDMPQAEQDRCEAGQALCVSRRCNPAVAQQDPQHVERGPARLV
jgi:hypothetical protein